jgi:hypothetical protein
MKEWPIEIDLGLIVEHAAGTLKFDLVSLRILNTPGTQGGRRVRYHLVEFTPLGDEGISGGLILYYRPPVSAPAAYSGPEYMPFG